MRTKQHHLLMDHRGGWQKPVRCALLPAAVMAAALVLAAPDAHSSEKPFAPPHSLNTIVKHSSSGKVLPCVPPQASRMDMKKTGTRVQRNAGDPSLSYAMVLSMALGLQSVAGPAENMKETVAAKAEPRGLSAGARTERPGRHALSDGRTACSGRMSMK